MRFLSLHNAVMPVPLIYRFSRAISLDSPLTVSLIAVFFALLSLRVWSSTSSLKVRRVLAGKTILVSVRQLPCPLSQIG